MKGFNVWHAVTAVAVVIIGLGLYNFVIGPALTQATKPA
jgi:hypothetical protein